MGPSVGFPKILDATLLYRMDVEDESRSQHTANNLPEPLWEGVVDSYTKS